MSLALTFRARLTNLLISIVTSRRRFTTYVLEPKEGIVPPKPDAGLALQPRGIHVKATSLPLSSSVVYLSGWL